MVEFEISCHGSGEGLIANWTALQSIQKRYGPGLDCSSVYVQLHMVQF